MNRYSYAYEPSLKGEHRYVVSDRLRGAPTPYETEDERAVALCRNADDADRVVNALNAYESLIDICLSQKSTEHTLNAMSPSAASLAASTAIGPTPGETTALLGGR